MESPLGFSSGDFVAFLQRAPSARYGGDRFEIMRSFKQLQA